MTATFSTPKADGVTIYVASKADIATDGHFLDENVVSTDFLTDSEIQSGNYLDQGQIDPGSYYVMLWASADFSQCYLSGGSTDPTCAKGMSNILQLTVPAPPTTWSAEALYVGQRVELTLTADQLGVKQPYQVCWPARTVRQKCVSGSVDGYSWNSSAHDAQLVDFPDLAPGVTTFTWATTGANPWTLATSSLTIPRPKWSMKADLLRNIGILYLTLSAKPLGFRQPYELCWKTSAAKRKCLRGTLNGDSWLTAARRLTRISTRGLASRTTFTLKTTGAHPTILATKTVATPPPKY